MTKASFYEHINTYPHSAPALPLVHSTLLENFADLAVAGQISPQLCPVFNKPLVYCFYGRPAYRSAKKGLKPSSIQDFMPVCFVFRPKAVRRCIDSVYPFDTGAAHGGRFLPHIDPAELQGFNMGRSLNATRRAITAFYDGNRNYFEAVPKPGLESMTFSSATVQKYVSLITVAGETEFDDRRSAFEIISDKPISFKGNILAVIAPRQFLANSHTRDLIENVWGAQAIHYSSIRATVPSEYVRAVAEQISVLLDKEGLL